MNPKIVSQLPRYDIATEDESRSTSLSFFQGGKVVRVTVQWNEALRLYEPIVTVGSADDDCVNCPDSKYLIRKSLAEYPTAEIRAICQTLLGATHLALFQAFSVMTPAVMRALITPQKSLN